MLIVSCAEQSKIYNLTPQQASDLLNEKEAMGLFVLNVHTPYEGEIEKTDAIIEDWESIANHQDQLPSDKNTPILVYCRSGRMSTSAVEQLQKLGYKEIYHLDGGMREWKKAGFLIMNEPHPEDSQG